MKRLVILSLVALLLLNGIVYAQSSPTSVECGTILESELTVENQKHNFSLDLAPGDSFNITIDPFGDTLAMATRIYEPSGSQFMSDFGRDGQSRELQSSVLSGRGNYLIQPAGYYRDDIGIYTLYVGCTLRDGTVIEPGDALTTTEQQEPQPALTVPSNFSGFPGLAPVDFSGAFRLPLNQSAPNQGEIPSTGEAILGFTLEGNEGDLLDLSFARLSGNLNLALVVLTTDDEVVFQASLITTQTLRTLFTLPSTGEYTIGIFRIDLLPPVIPEATSFQVQAKLNS